MEERFLEDSDSFNSDSILKDDFLHFGDETDIKSYLHNDKVCKMEDWDQDVLLSNAGLPELNPLLELGGEDDFQKMLNDWGDQIDSIQNADLNQENGVSSVLPSSEGKSKAGTISAEATAVESVTSPTSSGVDDLNMFLDIVEPKIEPSDPDLDTPVIKTEPGIEEPEVKVNAGPTLAGIVISSGPGGHFETFEVLEASDNEELLKQFEAIEEAMRNDDERVPDRVSAPYKKSQIISAVRNHFKSSKILPKIIPSRRIKDALPNEVIDQIKSSSQRTRTIAIIEPSYGKTNATFNQLSKNVPTIFPAPLPKMRFQDAATSLNKTKYFRQGLGSTHGSTSQVSLDHDYCSSANKLKRGTRAIVYQRPREFTTFPTTGKTVTPTPGVTIAKRNVASPIVVSSSSGISLSRPYVRVSTGSRVVTAANLLKPTPLSSRRVVSRSITIGNRQVVVQPNVQTAATTFRSRDADHKKDSGMESGDSDGQDYYTKVPQYLSTGVPVKSNDSLTITGVNDETSYDRLPAYITGIKKKAVVVHPDRERHTSSSSETSSTSVTSRRTTRSVTARKRRRTTSSSSNSSSSPTPARRKAKLRYSRSPSIHRRFRSPSNNDDDDDERRVVYVGKIAEGTTRADLRKRFQVFGQILEISVHFRDRGDNYGFVTFKYKADAYEAIQHGNDDPAFPKADICFGGRRTFCKEKYSDLDSMEIGGKMRGKGGSCSIDFDSLLEQARAGISK